MTSAENFNAKEEVEKKIAQLESGERKLYASGPNNQLVNSMKARFNILSILVIGFAAWGVWSWYQDSQLPIIREIVLTDARFISPSSLCPGDRLSVSVHIFAEGNGTLVFDDGVQSINPSKIIFFSDDRRAPIVGPIDQDFFHSWSVPGSYYNHETGVVESLLPGSYIKTLSFSSHGGRILVSQQIPFSFTILPKEECTDE